VVIVTASVGAGHNQVARAVAESLGDVPAVDVERIDAMDFVPGWFRTYYAGGFALAMSRFPHGYGVGFRLTNRPHGRRRALHEKIRIWHELHSTRDLGRHIGRAEPDLVLHTHFLGPLVVGRMIRRGELAAEQAVVVTDIEAHRWWYGETIARWFVPSEYTAGFFRRWGIDPQTITISGVPVLRKWLAPVDRTRVLGEWRLPSDKKIIVLTGGTEFTCGPILRIARRIVRVCPDAYVLALAGRNKGLLRRLLAMPEAPGRLKPVGFTDRLNELAGVSSLMVTKAGGITTAECIAQGTPMVLLKPVPGHEAGNAAYLARQGAAVVARRHRGLAEQVRQLLRDPDALAAMSANARRLHQPGAERVTGAVCRMLGLPAGMPARA
jgi:processive 1,2-diacylglycerol beta-glucosyltransferase